MNIVREQREQNNSLIKVTVGEKDYGDAVEKSLREYKRKANIPGFRPGMVPMGVIKKMYGKGVLAEQAYRQASEAAFNYLQEQKIDYVGDVILRRSRATSISRTGPNLNSSSRSAKLPR